MDRPWRSGFRKTPTEEPVYLGLTNLAGNGQADLVHHGGPDKAVCVFALSRYAYWQERLERSIAYGGFGENFTVSDQDEDTVCIGDIFGLGEAIVEVSQPRSPCWKLARRWQVKQLSLWFQESGFTGWYLRVLQPGLVAAGQEFILQERPNPAWTIARANEVRYDVAAAPEALASLGACEALGASWRKHFQNRKQGEFPDDFDRLIGQNDDE